MSASLRALVGSALDLIQVSVEVHQELNQHGWCFGEFRSTNDHRPPVESWLGEPITVEARDEGGTTTIFSGIVWQTELHHDVTGGYNVVVTGVTVSWKLEVTHDQNAFTNKTLAAIAQELAGEDGVAVQVKVSSDSRWPYLVQWGVPDMPFLVKRAYERKAWIRTTPKGIEIRDTFDQGGRLKWADGLNHYAVIGRLGTPSCTGTYYNPAQTTSKTLEKVSEAPGFFGSHRMSGAVVSASQRTMPSSGLYRSSHWVDEQDFNNRLKIESKRNLSQVYVIGVSREPKLAAGSTIEITDLRNGDGDGSCGVIKTVHTWTQANGYKNEFVATLATQWLSSATPRPYPPARVWQVADQPGLYPTGRGQSTFWNDKRFSSLLSESMGSNHYHLSEPYLGVVVARVVDNNDPDHLGRLKVQYIWAEEPTDWIRLVSPSAGSDRGILFLPEKGDEVLVAFEDGDPNQPVVIGSLWNSANNAKGVREPFCSEAGIINNDVKRIATKGGHRITLCDTPGEQGLTLCTPFACIKLLEKNPATGFPMIALETACGDIFLGAPEGRVHINSKFYSKEIG
jgi:type VI secretion system secreted protein VgrG